jgi:hypothetical protein
MGHTTSTWRDPLSRTGAADLRNLALDRREVAATAKASTGAGDAASERALWTEEVTEVDRLSISSNEVIMPAFRSTVASN